jgi:hypothetical protein
VANLPTRSAPGSSHRGRFSPAAARGRTGTPHGLTSSNARLTQEIGFMLHKKTLLSAILALMVSVPALVWASQLRVQDLAVGTYVSNRHLYGANDNFAPTVGQLYVFSRVIGAADNTHVYHRWYYGDKLMAEIPLSVRSGDWRTWSSKKIVPDWIGRWRVDVVNDDGSVIDSVTFVVS